MPQALHSATPQWARQTAPPRGRAASALGGGVHPKLGVCGHLVGKPARCSQRKPADDVVPPSLSLRGEPPQLRPASRDRPVRSPACERRSHSARPSTTCARVRSDDPCTRSAQDITASVSDSEERARMPRRPARKVAWILLLESFVMKRTPSGRFYRGTRHERGTRRSDRQTFVASNTPPEFRRLHAVARAVAPVRAENSRRRRRRRQRPRQRSRWGRGRAGRGQTLRQLSASARQGTVASSGSWQNTVFRSARNFVSRRGRSWPTARRPTKSPSCWR